MKNNIEILRNTYPIGSRVVLDEMNDPYCHMLTGLQGVCQEVDDAGNILVQWDNGSTLNLVPEADKAHVVSSGEEIKTVLSGMSAKGKPRYALGVVNESLLTIGS